MNQPNFPWRVILINKKYGTKHTYYRSDTISLSFNQGTYETRIDWEKPSLQVLPKSSSLDQPRGQPLQSSMPRLSL